MRPMAKETHIKTDKKPVGGWGAWELQIFWQEIYLPNLYKQRGRHYSKIKSILYRHLGIYRIN